MSTSSIRMTGKEKTMTAIHSSLSRGSTENRRAAHGTYRMKACSSMERVMPPSSHLFTHGGVLQGGRAFALTGQGGEFSGRRIYSKPRKIEKNRLQTKGECAHLVVQCDIP